MFKEMVFRKKPGLPQILDLRTVVLYKWGPKVCCVMIHVYDRLIITYIYKYHNNKHSIPSRLFHGCHLITRDFAVVVLGLWVSSLHLFLCTHVCLLPAEAQSKCQILYNWSCKWLWISTWVLEIQLGSFEKHSELLTAKPSYQHHRYLYVSASNQYELSTSRTRVIGDLIGSKNTNNSLIDGEINIALSWKIIWCLVNPHPIPQCFSLL